LTFLGAGVADIGTYLTFLRPPITPSLGDAKLLDGPPILVVASKSTSLLNFAEAFALLKFNPS